MCPRSLGLGVRARRHLCLFTRNVNFEFICSQSMAAGQPGSTAPPAAPPVDTPLSSKRGIAPTRLQKMAEDHAWDLKVTRSYALSQLVQVPSK